MITDEKEASVPVAASTVPIADWVALLEDSWGAIKEPALRLRLMAFIPWGLRQNVNLTAKLLSDLSEQAVPVPLNSVQKLFSPMCN